MTHERGQRMVSGAVIPPPATKRPKPPSASTRAYETHAVQERKVKIMPKKIDPRIAEVANLLEELSMIADHMVTDIREGADNPYERVYWLRKQIGYLVSRLGAGVPKAKDLQAIEDHYEKLVG